MPNLAWEQGKLKRALDAHSGLCALVAERARGMKDGSKQFDALWAGSLGAAGTFGLPDNGTTPFEWRLKLIEQIKRATALPIIFDAENGGGPALAGERIQLLGLVGASAAVIEDRAGPKSNSYSLRPQDSLMSSQDYSTTIKRAVDAAPSAGIQIISRLEGLVFGQGAEQVAKRALAIEQLGVDALLIHSKARVPSEVFRVASIYRDAGGRLPLVAVPTTYSATTESDLLAAGFSFVVYANQLLRAELGQMLRVAETILDSGRSADVDSEILGIQELLAYLEPLA